MLAYYWADRKVYSSAEQKVVRLVVPKADTPAYTLAGQMVGTLVGRLVYQRVVRLVAPTADKMAYK